MDSPFKPSPTFRAAMVCLCGGSHGSEAMHKRHTAEYVEAFHRFMDPATKALNEWISEARLRWGVREDERSR